MGVCIGVDVAKKHLDWVFGPNGEVERVENTRVARDPSVCSGLIMRRRVRKVGSDGNACTEIPIEIRLDICAP